MFNLLKDKLKSFVNSLVKREEEKKEEPAQAPPQPPPAPISKPSPTPAPKIEPKPEPAPAPKAEQKTEPARAPKPAPTIEHPKPQPREHAAQPKTEVQKTEAAKQQLRGPAAHPKTEAPKIAMPAQPVAPPKTEAPEAEERKPLDVKLSIESKLRSLFGGEVAIKEKDVDDLLEKLEVDLLEADVSYEVAELLKNELRSSLVGRKVKKGGLEREITAIVERALLSVMEKEKPNLVGMAKSKIKSEKPFIVLFLGPNGAGKTTTIAKFVRLFEKNGMSCVIALADTFRAASQEQGMEWAKRLNVKAIGGAYGSDPASVAYNAREHAKAKGIDVVLIDSAGRQETSKSLMAELEKIARVIKPDFKVYIGEAIAGNSVVEQVKSFDKYVGVDGVVLTKADVDAKGGSALSIYRACGKPILYLGVGQGEEDLREFDSKWVVGNIMT